MCSGPCSDRAIARPPPLLNWDPLWRAAADPTSPWASIGSFRPTHERVHSLALAAVKGAESDEVVPVHVKEAVSGARNLQEGGGDGVAALCQPSSPGGSADPAAQRDGSMHVSLEGADPIVVQNATLAAADCTMEARVNGERVRVHAVADGRDVHVFTGAHFEREQAAQRARRAPCPVLTPRAPPARHRAGLQAHHRAPGPGRWGQCRGVQAHCAHAGKGHSDEGGGGGGSPKGGHPGGDGGDEDGGGWLLCSLPSLLPPAPTPLPRPPQHVIKAPFDGVVEGLHFGAGDSVEDGAALLELARSEETE